jgi:hypothetical protein
MILPFDEDVLITTTKKADFEWLMMLAALDA